MAFLLLHNYTDFIKNMFKNLIYSTKKFIGAIFDLISTIVIALLP